MANKGSFLATGQYLSVDDYLVSDNGEFFAVMQSDGNFVLYRGSGPSDNQGYIWSISHTSLPTGQFFAMMQGDGNFVVYQGSDPAHQGTPIWATNTSWVSHRVTTGSSLTADDWMGTNDYLLSQNQLFAACMQDDGNFVLSYTTYSTSPTVRPRPDPSRRFWATIPLRARQGSTLPSIREDGHFILHNGPASGEEKDLTSSWSSSWMAVGTRTPLYRLPCRTMATSCSISEMLPVNSNRTGGPFLRSRFSLLPDELTTESPGAPSCSAGRTRYPDCLVSSNGLYFSVMQRVMATSYSTTPPMRGMPARISDSPICSQPCIRC